VDRPPGHCGIPGGGSPIAPPTWADLM
jgi:hypothetical protein